MMSGIVECHYCGQQKDKNYLQGFIAKCCMKRCNKYYCISCIHTRFNPEFSESNYRKDTWICYFCQETCNCLKCKHQELNEMERKKKSRPKNNVVKVNQQSADPQSASNFSLSNNINSFSGNNMGNATLGNQNSSVNPKPVRPSVEVMQKPIRQQQDYENNVIPQMNVHQEMMIPLDDIILLPPYLKKIAERKNMYFNFMSKVYKDKPEERSSSKKLKQIISSELSRRKGDTDGIDLDL